MHHFVHITFNLTLDLVTLDTQRKMSKLSDPNLTSSSIDSKHIMLSLEYHPHSNKRDWMEFHNEATPNLYMKKVVPKVRNHRNPFGTLD